MFSRLTTRLILAAGALALAPACSHTRRAEPVAPAPEPAADPAAAGTAPGQAKPVTGVPSGLPAGVRTTYNQIRTPQKVIAMTFDDGPHRQNTPRLLDMLKERGIKATFYVIGNQAAALPGIIKRMAAEGHEVAIHTWTHNWLNRLSDAGVERELGRSNDLLESLTGTRPSSYRPPGGNVTARQKEFILHEFGMPTIMWSVDPRDWEHRNAARTQSLILSNVHPGAIVLVHDLHKPSVDAMPGTLDGLIAMGYQFVTVSQLLQMGAAAAPPPPPATAPLAMTYSAGSW